MEFTPLQNLGRFFGFGKDRYIKTAWLNHNQILNGKTPQWVSINDNEVELFNTTAELQAVIMKKASMYSNGVFKHYQIQGSKIVDLGQTELIKKLENPNPLQSRNEWLQEEMIHSSVFGNSFLYNLKAFKSQEVPTCIYVLPANKMKVIPTGKIWQQTKLDGIISHYELINYNGNVERFETMDVIHSKIQNADNPIIGASPFYALQMEISNIRGAKGFRNVLINEHGAIGIISSGNKDNSGGVPLTADERKKVEKQYGKDYGLGDKQSKVLITSATLNWQPMVFPTKDLMLFEEISADFMSIINAYGLNDNLFSKEKGSTFANMEEGKKSAYQDTIIPYADDFTYKLSQYLKLDTKNEFLALDYSHIECLQANEEMNSQILERKANAISTLTNVGYTKEELAKIITL